MGLRLSDCPKYLLAVTLLGLACSWVFRSFALFRLFITLPIIVLVALFSLIIVCAPRLNGMCDRRDTIRYYVAMIPLVVCVWWLTAQLCLPFWRIN
jgi:hypothetical protein